MHHQTLKSAVAKYSPLLHGEDKSEKEIKEAILQDEKKFSHNEADEIFAAIIKPDDGQRMETPPNPLLSANIGTKPSLSRQYEEWKVKANVGHKLNRETEEKERFVTFEKDAQSPIRVTSITPDKAAILNEQSENTLLRLYEVK